MDSLGTVLITIVAGIVGLIFAAYNMYKVSRISVSPSEAGEANSNTPLQLNASVLSPDTRSRICKLLFR